jgi:hypothetical protein
VETVLQEAVAKWVGEEVVVEVEGEVLAESLIILNLN